MPATEISVTIGSISFNTSFTPGVSCYLLFSTEQIIDALRTRRTDTLKQGEHGSEDSLSSYEPRVLLFRGEIHATSQSQRVTMQQALDAAVGLSRSQDFDGDDGYKLIQITDEDGIAKQIYAKIEQMPRYELIDDTMPESRRFDFVMFASDPAVYAQSLSTETSLESYASTDFTFQDGDLPTFDDDDLPTCQDTVGNGFQVTNSGTYASPPEIILVGPLTNPVITNSTTGRKLAFTRNGGVSLADSSETLTVNSADYTAVKTVAGVDTNVRSKLSLDSDWFDIVPGVNELNMIDDTAGDLSGQLTVNFRSAWA